MSFTAKARSYKRVDIYNSETGTMTRNELVAMEANPKFLTDDGSTSDHEHYPDGIIPFVKKHLHYLHMHPDTNPEHYLSNLRAKLRLR